MKKNAINLSEAPEFSEDILGIVASIIGRTSAASKVLADMKERRDRGEDPVCLCVPGGFLVVLDRKDLKP